jgi:hypothetical protein
MYTDKIALDVKVAKETAKAAVLKQEHAELAESLASLNDTAMAEAKAAGTARGWQEGIAGALAAIAAHLPGLRQAVAAKAAGDAAAEPAAAADTAAASRIG